MKTFAIILLSVGAAIFFGLVQDQVTARICVEYFTIGHARLIDSDSPTVLALFWGVVATWWVGLVLGIGLAMAARAGKRPKLEAPQFIRPIAVLLACMFCAATMAGAMGYFFSSAGIVVLPESLAARIPPERHVAFLTDWWAHSGAYLAGGTGGVVLWVVTWIRRGKMGGERDG